VPTVRPSNRKTHKTRGGKIVAERWWTKEEGKAHNAVWDTVENIRRSTEELRKWDRHHALLYSNLNVAGLGNAGGNRNEQRVRFNLIAQAVDTAASQIATQRPKPMYLTSEGDFKLQRQARLRTRVLEGQLHDLGAYDIMPEVFVDAAVLGTGFVYGYIDPDTKEPKLERCLPGTVFVDPRDGNARDPMCMYYRILVAREVLEELYPDCAKAIKEAEGPNSSDKTDLWLSRDTTVDDVVVVFAWRRPVKKRGEGGRFVISTSAGTLLDTDWKWSIPLRAYRWKKRQVGFWGTGIAEAGRDPQARINRLIKFDELAQNRGSVLWCAVDRNSKIRVEQLTNEPMKIVHYENVPPVFIQNDGKFQGVSASIAEIREQFFSEQGISQMAAEAKKPAGLDSGAAQRAYQDITSQRHQVQAKGFETAYMELVELLEELNERADEESEGGYKVTARTQRGRVPLVNEVKWADVALPENKYRLTCFPTSALPATPAGKMAMVSEWIASGFISRPYAQQLALDLPDTDQAARMELADMDCVMHDCERMLDGEPAYPDPHLNLEMAADIARRSYLQIKCQDAPEDILQLFRDYISDCMELLKPAAPAPNAAAPMVGGPGAPPVPPALPADPMGQPLPGGMPIA
jgi:hypothetical protein